MTVLAEQFVLSMLGVAALCDLRTGKVPNRLIVAGYLAGAILMIRQPGEILQFLVCVCWPIALLYPLFLIRAFGAGDIKLISMISVFVRTDILIRIMLGSLVIGAIISVTHLLMSRVRGEEPHHFIHYSICIWAAFAVVLCLPH